jgi:glycosyltransferase involved in cell wall biosynthesis
MKIGIIGTRGIPNRYGGFERFTEVLVDHPGWTAADIQFVVYGEGSDGHYNEWTSTRCVGFSKARNGLAFYRKSAALAAHECDVVLSCGVGISIFAFLVRLRGATLVVNPDGCEWRRSKWSMLGRLLIRAMYWPALAAAHYIIIDAEALREDFGLGSSLRTRYIGYQAPEPRLTPLTQATRDVLALTRPFVLCIVRLEPENNVEMVVQSFVELGRDDLDLIIVGPTTTRHYEDILSRYVAPRIRFVGAIFDQTVLDELRSNCVAYVHGHSVGGTNPSLLEALARVGGVIYCHDNKYNREVAADKAIYFNSALVLAAQLAKIGEKSNFGAIISGKPLRDARFEPDNIFRRYIELFEEIRATR